MRALNGVRVLDLSRFVASPFCCQILGDNGADVVKGEEAARISSGIHDSRTASAAHGTQAIWADGGHDVKTQAWPRMSASYHPQVNARCALRFTARSIPRR